MDGSLAIGKIYPNLSARGESSPFRDKYATCHRAVLHRADPVVSHVFNKILPFKVEGDATVSVRKAWLRVIGGLSGRLSAITDAKLGVNSKKERQRGLPIFAEFRERAS